METKNKASKQTICTYIYIFKFKAAKVQMCL